MTLSELDTGELAIVEAVVYGRHGDDLANRLAALGLVSNKPVRVLRRAKFGGPLHVQVGLTTEIAIRSQEAATVQVRRLEDLLP